MEVFRTGEFRRLVAVRAPAAFGKSIQLQHWREEVISCGGQTAWLTLDTGDNSSERFLRGLVDAIRYARPGFGAALLTIFDLSAIPGPRDTATLLINELAAQPQHLHIFLDEFHHIESPYINDFLEFFLRHTPQTVQLVVATRGDLNFSLSYLRLSGLALEVRERDLAFTPDEVEAFLATRENMPPFQSIAGIMRRAEGWVGILQVLALRLTRVTDPSQEKNFSNKDNALKEFFQKDVLAGLPLTHLELLAKASLFPRFNAPLCDATLGAGSGVLIQGLIRNYGLPFFHFDEDNSWYRCHQIFAEFMQIEVLHSTAESITKLHKSASLWLARSGRSSDAIAHALLANDFGSAADLLDRAAEMLSRSGQIEIFLDYVSHIPGEVLRCYPYLRLRQVWVLTLVWKFRDARMLLADLRANRLIDAASAPHRENDFEAELLRREMTLELVSDNLLHAHTLGGHLLAAYPPADPEQRRAIEMEVFYASQNMFDCSNLDAAWALAATLRANPEESYASVWTDCVVANAEWLRGSIDEAEALCRSAIATAAVNEPSDRAVALAAMPSALLAEFLYERNDLAQARRLAEEVMPHLGEVGLLDPAIAGYLATARLHFIDGQFKEAEAVLSRANQLAVNRGFKRLRLSLLAERIRQALHRGRLEEALRLARSGALLSPAEAMLPPPNPTIEDLTRAIVWARVACARGHATDALGVLRRWQRIATTATYDLLVVRLAIQIALALNLHGDALAARRQIKLALEKGEPAGLIRSFLDEGEPVRRLVQEVIEHHTHLPPDPLASYASRILGAFQAERPLQPSVRVGADDETVDLPSEPLSDRQLEILRLVSSGLSNRDIAADLGLSEGTVKWYLHDAFIRLGVRRRSQAIRRAYQLGFLR